MNFVNPPAEPPQNVFHKTFFSRLLNHEIGYNIYLPPGYADCGEKYPAAYHLHGWKGNESCELSPMEPVYRNSCAITVFPNYTPVVEYFSDIPVERMLIDELIPHIDGQYRTDATRESRAVSGFSMGGGMAFCYAVKNPGLFSSVTAYAGTYHHYFHKDARTVGEPPEKAAGLYNEMMKEERHLEEGNILCLIRQNAEKIRGKLELKIHVGTTDVLYCDNEILRLHLESLNIPHSYKRFYNAGHELSAII